jgi:hypothetical protein
MARRTRRALLNSESASLLALWIVLAVICVVAIGTAIYGMWSDDETIGAPSAATTGEAPLNR